MFRNAVALAEENLPLDQWLCEGVDLSFLVSHCCVKMLTRQDIGSHVLQVQLIGITNDGCFCLQAASTIAG